jgi:hypothetical protein
MSPTTGAVIALTAAATLAYVMYRRRHGEHPPRRTEFDRLINESIAHDIAPRLGLDTSVVLKVLTGEDDDASVRAAIDRRVCRVEVETTRLKDQPGRVHLRRRVEFDTGDAREVTWDVAWTSLPDDLRARFIRSGDQRVQGEWTAPWHTTRS